MLYWAILFFALLILVITMIKINIVIEFLKDNKDDHFVISAFIFGGALKYKYELPIFSLNEEGIRMKLVKERGKKEKKTGENKKEFQYSDIYKWIKDARYIYKKNYTAFCSINSYTSKKIVFEDIRLNMLIGAGEAHYTAILNGMLWALLGSGLGFLCSKFRVKNKNMVINSDFSQKKLLVDFYCIFNFKIVHIIVIAIKLLSFYLRGKLNIKIKTVGGELSG